MTPRVVSEGGELGELSFQYLDTNLVEFRIQVIRRLGAKTRHSKLL